MDVSLVYLGRDDNDKEMYNMCKAIAKKLTRARIQVEETNSDDGENLPKPNKVTYNEVWFCGHSRFVEANTSIRKIDQRKLGGFPIEDMGSLEAQKKMDDSEVKELQRQKFAKTFENAHCKNKGLPDFFGFRIRQNFLVEWVPTRSL